MFAMSLFIINGKRLIGFHSIEFFLSYFGSGVDWAQPKIQALPASSGFSDAS